MMPVAPPSAGPDRAPPGWVGVGVGVDVTAAVVVAEAVEPDGDKVAAAATPDPPITATAASPAPIIQAPFFFGENRRASADSGADPADECLVES